MTALDELRTSITGTVVLPGDPDYDTARQPWNLAVDQRPAAIVTPADVRELQTVVRTAAGAGLKVTVQPNGHGADGDLEGVVLVRTSRFDELAVDVPARVLRAGAGVNWGRALHELDGTGLVALAGSNPEVSIVGLALNGGHSMFSRRYGLTARSIITARLVDAAGDELELSDADDPDLIWALRGGGGHFGIVTEIELALHAGDALFGGSLMFAPDHAVAAITAAFDLSRQAPDLGLEVGMMRFPDVPIVPEPMRGKTVATVAMVHVGDETEGRAYAERLLSIAEPVANTLTAFTIGSLAAVAAEPVDPMPTVDFGGPLSGFDEAFASDFVAAFLAGAERGLGRCGLRVLGGAIADELGAERSAVGALHAPLLMNAGVVLLGPGIDPAAALQPLRELAAKYPATGGVPSFLGVGTTLADAYPPEVVERLAQIKRRFDPTGVFVGNRPIARG
ncbi:FAD-binding oxidoreductase [Agromyces intestinalis]|uniref:FAD-binding oxidoreductase n=1 Tax=Agromyces intestinalis TaxID=2592652 RepID=A0A5C1YCU0_9MICO|nr:FAD-binding oxidoreductase [Agromyces intestinalis]QEO13861.1 FAD-binding oxidoreductase [Agromyces intestinalis]